jgi:putative SOS response-associated peptidase YedK
MLDADGPDGKMHRSMVALYRLDAAAAEIAARFGADPGADPWAGDYVTPGRFAPVIVRGRDGMRRLVPRLYGVPPPPAAALGGARPVATVRNLESPFWIGNLRHTQFRCLIPVTAFQLWGPAVDHGTERRAQHWLGVSSQSIFAFAGIWRDSEVMSFAILTCEPNRLVGALQTTAMPVILEAENYDAWLRGDWKEAQKLVASYPSQLMRDTVAGPSSPPPLD